MKDSSQVRIKSREGRKCRRRRLRETSASGESPVVLHLSELPKSEDGLIIQEIRQWEPFRNAVSFVRTVAALKEDRKIQSVWNGGMQLPDGRPCSQARNHSLYAPLSFEELLEVARARRIRENLKRRFRFGGHDGSLFG